MIVEEAPRRRRVKDEEVLAVLLKVVLDEGTVASQKRLARLVNRRLPRGGRVGGARVRRLAVRSGLVRVAVTTRRGGATPELSACPVCGAKLRRTANRTLTGEEAWTGYRCTRCPWWTGRELRVPHRYVFQSRVSRAGGREEQLAFIPPDAE